MTDATDMSKILVKLEGILNNVVDDVVSKGKPIVHKDGIIGSTWK